MIQKPGHVLNRLSSVPPELGSRMAKDVKPGTTPHPPVGFWQQLEADEARKKAAKSARKLSNAAAHTPDGILKCPKCGWNPIQSQESWESQSPWSNVWAGRRAGDAKDASEMCDVRQGVLARLASHIFGHVGQSASARIGAIPWSGYVRATGASDGRPLKGAPTL